MIRYLCHNVKSVVKFNCQFKSHVPGQETGTKLLSYRDRLESKKYLKNGCSYYSFNTENNIGADQTAGLGFLIRASIIHKYIERKNFLTQLIYDLTDICHSK